MRDAALPPEARSALSPEPHASLGEVVPLKGVFPKSDLEWLLIEEGFNLAREHEIESLFAIGNGYIGNRASLAEGSPLSAPATFVAGIFVESTPGAGPQLLVLPDWAGVRIWVEGNPLDMSVGEILEHRRILDMRHGVFWREWRHRDGNGRISNLVAVRLASLVDRHLLLQAVAFRAENYSGTVRFDTTIELAPDLKAFIPPGWKTRRRPERPDVIPIALYTPNRHHTVALAVGGQLLGSRITAATREMEFDERRIFMRYQASIQPGGECYLYRALAVATSRDSAGPYNAAKAHVEELFPARFVLAASAHLSEWEARQRSADVQLEGDDDLQRALRFAQYHLISAANPEDEGVSIGARGLTGEAYKGHVFWDTEIYMLPFYLCTHPRSARSLLMYRYRTLNAAREKAHSAGFRGAMYPWESADTGQEVTPRRVIAPSGEVLDILNGVMEVHISADVAFAIWQYWSVSGDDEFLLQAGGEVLLETARFWASRGSLEDDGRFHIRHVIGPDEYHDDVDDDVYTNLLAAWNLRAGAAVADLLDMRWPEAWRESADRLHVTSEEVDAWRKLAQLIFIGFHTESNLFEQFTGYFSREAIDLTSYEPRTAAMDAILGHRRIQETNIVKQADVVLALYLLWDQIPADVRAANFRYYESRTDHGSSLSPSIHALVAARLGETDLARRYVKQAAEIDLCNNMGNAAGGVHMAALGGLWQAVVFGFAGVSIQPDGIVLAPKLLPEWRRLRFPLLWRKNLLTFSLEPRSIHVAVQGPDAVNLRLVDGGGVTAEPGREYIASSTKTGWTAWQAT